MKLRNKKTGEIGNFCYGYTNELCVSWQKDDGFWGKQEYNSLAELNEEWEDYEEQKGNWTIDPMNENYIDDGRYTAPDELERYEELGLKFNTREEAEKAVEKLKAWKRLKDKGFEIEGWDNNIGDDYYKTGQIVLNLNNVRNREWDEYDQIMEIKNDLDLLFGGEC